MAKVWVAVKDDYPGMADDPIVAIFGSVRTAVTEISKLLGGDPKVEKRGTEVVLTSRKDKYIIKPYSVRN